MAYEFLRKSPQARAQEAAKAPKPKPPPKAAKAAGTPNFAPYYAVSRGDLERAAAQAVKAERARVAAVFNSPDSRGRERGCAALLTSEQNWTAATICAQLAHLPTDAQVAADASKERAQAAGALWDKAVASLKGAK